MKTIRDGLIQTVLISIGMIGRYLGIVMLSVTMVATSDKSKYTSFGEGLKTKLSIAREATVEQDDLLSNIAQFNKDSGGSEILPLLIQGNDGRDFVEQAYNELRENYKFEDDSQGIYDDSDLSFFYGHIISRYYYRCLALTDDRLITQFRT